MKLFWSAILSVLIGLGPIVPQLALAAPLRGSDTTEAEYENSFEILNLGSEEEPLRVLFVNIREKDNIQQTLKKVKPHLEDAAREYTDLRFMSLTIHPQDLGEREETGERLTVPVSYQFWRDDANEVISNEIGTEARRIYSESHLQSAYNRHRLPESVKTVIKYNAEANPNVDDSASFLKVLSQKDIDEYNLRRPRTDITTGAIRGAATALGVAIAVTAGSGGEATWLQTVTAAALPGGLAFWSGLRNQRLTDWEQRSNAKNKYLKEIVSISKNVGLAFGYVAALQISMLGAHTLGNHLGQGAQLLENPVTLGSLGIGLAIGAGRNIAKKTFLLRALNNWKHNKYETDPRNAAKYSRTHAWAMAIVGGLITATDLLQFLPNTYEFAQSSSIGIDIAMGVGGAAAFFAGGKIMKLARGAKSKCSKLFSSKPKAHSFRSLPDDVQ